MHADDQIEAKGRLRLELRGPDGSLKQVEEVDNLVTTVGKGVIANRMQGTPSIAAMTHMAVGTTNTAAAVGDTTLGAEVAGSRQALTSTNVAGAVITYVGTFAAGVGTGSLVEAGIFNASSAGSMLNRAVYGTITKGALDTLTITWTVTIS